MFFLLRRRNCLHIKILFQGPPCDHCPDHAAKAKGHCAYRTQGPDHCADHVSHGVAAISYRAALAIYNMVNRMLAVAADVPVL